MCRSSFEPGGPRRCSAESRSTLQRAVAALADLQGGMGLIDVLPLDERLEQMGRCPAPRRDLGEVADCLRDYLDDTDGVEIHHLGYDEVSSDLERLWWALKTHPGVFTVSERSVLEEHVNDLSNRLYLLD